MVEKKAAYSVVRSSRASASSARVNHETYTDDFLKEIAGARACHSGRGRQRQLEADMKVVIPNQIKAIESPDMPKTAINDAPLKKAMQEMGGDSAFGRDPRSTALGVQELTAACRSEQSEIGDVVIDVNLRRRE